MRWSHGLGICIIFALFACGGGESGGGCGSEYEYPQTLEAEPTDKAIQARVTQQGIDVFAASVPGFLAQSCSGGDFGGGCFMEPCDDDDDSDPEWFNFILEEQDVDMVAHLYSESPGSYTGECGPAYSSMGFELESLRQGLKVNLFSDDRATPGVVQDGIEVNVSNVDLKLDAKIKIAGITCDFDPSDSTSGSNMTLNQLTFYILPKVELIDGHATLVMGEENIIVDEFVMDTSQLDGGNFLCILGTALVSLFEEVLVTIIADALVDQFSGEVLEASGELDLNEFISMPNAAGNPVGYLLRANEDSLTVTGLDDYNEGLNFDIDAGFAGEHSHCVGVIEPPSFSLPTVPEITNSIEQPHPETGIMNMDFFHVAALVGDVTFTRALYELFDSGAFCMRLKAETLGELTGGVFAPTVSTIALLAPDVLKLTSADAPVDIAILPGLPAVIKYGTGEGEGDARDSHFQLIWQEFSVRLYTYVDDELLQFLGIGMDLDFGLSFEVSAAGDLEFQIDRIKIENVHAVYNEMNLDFDPDGVAELVELFLPTLLSEAPLNIELTAAALGIPYVPKARAVERLGDEGRYLGFFFKLCTPDQLNDTTDALCYEDLSSGSVGNSLKHLAFRLEEVPDKGDEFWVEIENPELNPSELEVSYRLHAGEPWQSFRSLAADGTLHVDHPALYFPGTYEVFFRIRDKNRPGLWSEVRSTHVLIDKAAPVLKAWRQGHEVRWHVQDDATAAERIKIKAEVLYAGERRVHDFALREMLEVHPQASVRLWAMDAKGHVSTAVFLDAQALKVSAGASAMPYGCQSNGPVELSFLLLIFVLMPLLRIRLKKTIT